MTNATTLKQITIEAQNRLANTRKTIVDEMLTPILEFCTEVAHMGSDHTRIVRGWMYDSLYEEEVIVALEEKGFEITVETDYLRINWA